VRVLYPCPSSSKPPLPNLPPAQDEFNLAPASVTAALTPLLEGAAVVHVPGGPTVPVAPGFRWFGTQNASRGSQDRNPLPLALRTRMLEVRVPDFTPEELRAVLSTRQDIRASATDAQALGQLYFALQRGGGATPGQPGPQAGQQTQPAAGSAGAAGAALLPFTLREVIKILRRTALLRVPACQAALSLLLTKVRRPALSLCLPSCLVLVGMLSGGVSCQTECTQRPHPKIPSHPCPRLPLLNCSAQVQPGREQELVAVLQSVEGWSGVRLPAADDYEVKTVPGGVRFAMGPMEVLVPGADLSRVSASAGAAVGSAGMPPSMRRTLVHLALAFAAGEPVLLVGPTCHKSAAVRAWCEMTGRTEELITTHLTAGARGGGCVCVCVGVRQSGCLAGGCFGGFLWPPCFSGLLASSSLPLLARMSFHRPAFIPLLPFPCIAVEPPTPHHHSWANTGVPRVRRERGARPGGLAGAALLP
jgi:hypothetical protein